MPCRAATPPHLPRRPRLASPPSLPGSLPLLSTPQMAQPAMKSKYPDYYCKNGAVFDDGKPVTGYLCEWLHWWGKIGLLRKQWREEADTEGHRVSMRRSAAGWAARLGGVGGLPLAACLQRSPPTIACPRSPSRTNPTLQTRLPPTVPPTTPSPAASRTK